MYRSSPPSAGAWYTIDVELNPYCGRAWTLSSTMTATGRRWPTVSGTATPSSVAYPDCASSVGLGVGVAEGDGDGEDGEGAAEAGTGDCTGADPAEADGSVPVDADGPGVWGAGPQPVAMASASIATSAGRRTSRAPRAASTPDGLRRR